MKVQLVVQRHCITQVDPTSRKALADYHYKDIDALIKVGGVEWAGITACGWGGVCFACS